MSMGSIGGKGVHMLQRVLDNPLLNGYFVAKSFSSMMSSGADTMIDAGRDGMSVDQNTFERFGRGIGQTVTEGADMVSAGVWFGHGLFRQNPMHSEAFRFVGPHGYENFTKVNGDMLHVGPSGKTSQLPKWANAAKIEEEGVRGMIGKKGNFLKNMGVKGMAATMLVPMAIGIAAGPLLGFAGKVMDEAYTQQRRQRMVNYDERYIVNQQQDMSTYQQVGAAMDSYQNRMMSMSRIYHSR